MAATGVRILLRVRVRVPEGTLAQATLADVAELLVSEIRIESCRALSRTVPLWTELSRPASPRYPILAIDFQDHFYVLAPVTHNNRFVCL